MDRETLVDRVLGNVVEPFCHFVELAGPRSAEVLASCPEGSAQRRVSPIYVVLGNHDSRNVGYVHFEEMFGPRHSELHANGVTIVAEDSSEPDLNHGQVGRNRPADQSRSTRDENAHRVCPPLAYAAASSSSSIWRR